MKKKPSLIFSILLNTLNELDVKKEYSVNEISEKSGLHWKTTSEYLDILIHILRFAPEIKLNLDNGKVVVENRSSYYAELSNSQKILIFLFENKAFDVDSAISLTNFDQLEDFEIYIDDLILKDQILKEQSKGQYYLLKAGKEIVHSIFSQITKSIFKNKSLNYPDEEETDQIHLELSNMNEKISQLTNEIIALKSQKNIIMSQKAKITSSYKHTDLINNEETVNQQMASLELQTYFAALETEIEKDIGSSNLQNIDENKDNLESYLVKIIQLMDKERIRNIKTVN